MHAPISQDEFKAVSDEATRLIESYAERARMPFVDLLLSKRMRGWLNVFG